VSVPRPALAAVGAKTRRRQFRQVTSLHVEPSRLGKTGAPSSGRPCARRHSLRSAASGASRKEGEAQERPEADVVFGEPCRFEAWPAVPIHVIAGRDDRFFPIEFQRRVAQERLQVPVGELPGGHLLALANPRGLADRLLGYLGEG
jgi:pimeloyl-ACP methyl ester carboxylesterase